MFTMEGRQVEVELWSAPESYNMAFILCVRNSLLDHPYGTFSVYRLYSIVDHELVSTLYMDVTPKMNAI